MQSLPSEFFTKGDQQLPLLNEERLQCRHQSVGRARNGQTRFRYLLLCKQQMARNIWQISLQDVIDEFCQRFGSRVVGQADVVVELAVGGFAAAVESDGD